MTPDDSKFIADVKEQISYLFPKDPERTAVERLLTIIAERDAEIAELGTRVDGAERREREAIADCIRLSKDVAERDAEIARLEDEDKESIAAIDRLIAERKRLRKMVEVAKGAIGCAMMEYQDETQSGSESAGKMYVVLDRNLAELDRLEKESL